jgi:hypothetical protein
VHAGVDLEPGADRGGRARRFEQRDLPVLVDEWLEAVMRREPELFGVAKPFEQHDARAASGFTKRHGLLRARDGERVRAGERAGCGGKPVSVGVGLDDRKHPAARGELADPREVVLQRCRVDDGAQRRAQNAPSP